MTEYRIEHDTMGEVKVPADALWRAQTQRAVDNFPISGRGLENAQIRALGLLKAACAQVNKDSGKLDADKADAIIAAATEIAEGKHNDAFPIDVFQTGSGTSSNMNTNEVIASLAHQNDVVKAGRTHLMDATPVTLGQEFGGYARQIELAIERIEAALPRLGELAIGGTATGTGLNTSAAFGAKVTEELKKLTGVAELKEAENHFEAQAARDGLVEFSGAMRAVAVSLNKIANDLRMMGSGPLTGLAEIHLKDLQPGSSIMPGKVNPVIPEAVTMVSGQVVGNDAAVAFGGAQGHFELNVFIPMMARNVLESARLLSNASRVFADKCIDHIEANEERMKHFAESSTSIVTPLNSAIGYENAAKAAKHALHEKITVRQAVIDLGFVDGENLTEEELDKRLDVLSMTNRDRDNF